MKRILITFGGAAYNQQIGNTLRAIGERGDADDLRVYDDRWLMEQPFYRENKWIFDRKPQHGFGFCSWKPYIIQHALKHFAEAGDVVMYLDGDTYPIADISCLFEFAAQAGVMLFEEQGCVNKTWIKHDCFVQMWCDYPHHRDAMIACGRFQLFKKPLLGSFTWDNVLADWQRFALDPLCTFHEGSLNGGDDPSFIKNSCEQSVLSLLAAKLCIPLHRTPDQNGWPVAWDGKYKPKDKYPQLFVQDGARGNIHDLRGSRYRNV
jgi:hypothetical protein